MTLGLLSASCGNGADESLGVSNVSPKGSVGGLVIDAATMQAMEGVGVTVIAGGRILPSSENAALTDAKGFFTIDDVPTGDLIIEVTPKDPAAYKPVIISATLASAAGDFPLGNATLSLGPIGLLPLTKPETAFRVQLVTPDGAPAPANIKAFLRTAVAWVDWSSGNPVSVGTVVVSAASDNSGVVSFAGMPDFNALAGLVGSGGISDQVWVSIPPYDANNDGILDFLGKEVSFSLSSLQGAIATIVLSSSPKPPALRIEASSLAALAGNTGNRMLSSLSGPLFVTFNMPIEEKLTQISLYSELGSQVLPAPTKTVNGNMLTISFSTLTAGTEYNVNLRVFAKVEGHLVEGNFGAPFFTPIAQDATVQGVLSQDTANPSRIKVTFNEPIGTGKAGMGLTGANAVLFFNADLDGSGVTGDFPGERGAQTSSFAFNIDEVDPPGPADLSGLATTWSFLVPSNAFDNPLPSGTAMDMVFSRANLPVQRADGRLVPDMENMPSLLLP